MCETQTEFLSFGVWRSRGQSQSLGSSLRVWGSEAEPGVGALALGLRLGVGGGGDCRSGLGWRK